MSMFTVILYAGARHPRGLPYGTHILTVTCDSEHVASTEIDVSMVRQQRGEVGKIELIDHRSNANKNLTCMNVHPWANIQWSWLQ